MAIQNPLQAMNSTAKQYQNVSAQGANGQPFSPNTPACPTCGQAPDTASSLQGDAAADIAGGASSGGSTGGSSGGSGPVSGGDSCPDCGSEMPSLGGML